MHVDDDGPGIEPQLRKKLFEPFTRADASRNRQSGGFGLGLAIVAKIAHWHEGQASVTDSPGNGTRLEIRWPVAHRGEQCGDRSGVRD